MMAATRVVLVEPEMDNRGPVGASIAAVGGEDHDINIF